MAIRYQNVFYSNNDSRYRISIDDDTLGSDANLVFDLSSNLFNLSYDGQSDNRFQSVITSRVTLSVMVNSTDLEDFIDDTINSVDGRFKLKIEQYNKGTLTYNLFWVGTIITDQVTYEDASYPFLYNITAIDQLGTLSEIDYNDAGTAYSGKETILQHILNCLVKTDLDYFHTVSDPFIKTITTWYENDHVYNAGDPADPLLNTRIDHIGFYREDDDDNIIFFDCLTVLKELAQVFGVRIYQSGGAIRFEQVNEREDADFYEFSYNNVLTELSKGLNTTDTVTTNKTKSKTHLAGGQYSFLPGLKYINYAYSHESDRNLLLNNVWQISSNFEVNVGSIVSDQTTSTFKFTANLYIQVFTNSPSSDEYRVDFNLKLKHGSQYLKRTITPTGNSFIFYPMEWDTAAENYELTTDWINESQIIEIPISFETPVVPEAIGDLIFDFNHGQIYKKNGTGNNMNLGFWELQNPYLEFYSDGKPDIKNTRTFQINNDFFTNNTQTKKLTGFIGDAITNVTRGKLEINNGTSGEDSAAWSINQAGTTYSIMELMIYERLAGQKRGTTKYNGSFQILNFAFHKRIVYSTDNYMMMSGSFSANSDTWTGSFFNINASRSNMTFGTEINSGSSGGGTPSGGTGGNTSGTTTISFTPPEPEFFDNVTGASITGIAGTLPPNSLANQYLEVYRDGRKLRHTTDFTIDETNNEIDLVLQAMGEGFEIKIY